MVLLRPKSPGNVGSVARAMKNMGFERLILADPISYDDPDYFAAEAGRMAWQAGDVLERRESRSDLETALAPFSLVAGTSSRPTDGVRVMSPKQLAAFVAGRLSSDPTALVALLLGQEDNGLTREHQARCHVVGSIPSSGLYASLNLAQAALLFLYELRLAFLETRDSAAGLSSSPDHPIEPPPSHGEMEAFFSRLEPALETIDFFQGTARDHMMREMRRIFNRALLSRRELAILEGLTRQIEWASRKRG